MESIKELQDRIEELMKQNRSLRRINKEKANSDRNLQPKKEHSGYVVHKSIENIAVFYSSWMKKEVRFWQTTVQTPYNIHFSQEEVQSFAEEEFLNNLMHDIGIVEYKPMTKDEFVRINDFKENYAYSITYYADYRTHYWSIIINHSLPLGGVPAYMDVRRRR